MSCYVCPSMLLFCLQWIWETSAKFLNSLMSVAHLNSKQHVFSLLSSTSQPYSRQGHTQNLFFLNYLDWRFLKGCRSRHDTALESISQPGHRNHTFLVSHVMCSQRPEHWLTKFRSCIARHLLIWVSVVMILELINSLSMFLSLKLAYRVEWYSFASFPRRRKLFLLIIPAMQYIIILERHKSCKIHILWDLQKTDSSSNDLDCEKLQKSYRDDYSKCYQLKLHLWLPNTTLSKLWDNIQPFNHDFIIS